MGKGWPKHPQDIREEEIVNSLNTYINNLGFIPTRICVTLRHTRDKHASMYSQATKNVISQGMTLDTTKYPPYGFWSPELGLFMDAKQKVFAVRSDVDETTPKVYSFSQLQYFEVSQDIRESSRGAIYSHGVAIGLGGGLKGKLLMRVVFSGENGPESVTLQPALKMLGMQLNTLSTNNPVYKLKLEELTAIADCLQWIHDNA